MPLERKILLSILIALIAAFGLYGLYSTYYVNYRDKISKTTKYRQLIENNSQITSKITQWDIDKLEDINSSYRDLYFTEEESKGSNLAPIIKKRLERYSIEIKQYSLTEESARYTISGKKWDLTNFLYSLSGEKKNYSFPIFNIRMINNTDFQGTIEIRKPVIPLKRGRRSIKEGIESLPYRAPYSNSASYSLGTEFIVQEEPEIVEEVVQAIEVKEPELTDKFYFVGKVKDNSNTTLLFKERSNGRIFKFTKGEILSGWKYLEEVDNGWLFLYKDKEYRVKR